MSESAAERFEALAEFGHLDGSIAIEIEVLKNTLASLAFIIGAMGTLTDLLKDNVTDLLETGGVNLVLVSTNTPCVAYNLGEVCFTFSGKHTVHKGVVDAELLLRAGAISADSVEFLAEIGKNDIGFLFTRENARVLVSVVTRFKFVNGAAGSTTGKLSPGTLNDSEARVAHVSAHSLNEFIVGNAAILVVVKVVHEGTELLCGEEDAKSGEHGLKLQFVEDLVLVFVVALKDLAQLSDAVYALSVELELELVDDLLEAVSPVCHFF